jgi:hypothetical protein
MRSHHGPDDREPHRMKPQGFPQSRQSADIIDLKPEEYKVISESSK